MQARENPSFQLGYSLRWPAVFVAITLLVVAMRMRSRDASCPSEADGLSLYRAGRLERAGSLLETCRSRSVGAAAALADIHNTLAQIADPDALLTEALAIRTTNPSAAQRLADRALASAEARGGRASVVPWGSPRESTVVWAPDGRHVAFVPEACPSVGTGPTMVDVSTGHAFRIDGCFDKHHFVFSPNGRLVALAHDLDRRLGFEVSVIDAETGSVVAAPRGTAAEDQYFTADSKILWTDEDSRQLFVHVKAIAGAETILAAPAEPEETRRTGFHGIMHVWFIDDQIIGWTHEHVFVWRDGALIATSTLAEGAPQLDDRRLVFRIADGRLAVIDLTHAERGVITLPTVSVRLTDRGSSSPPRREACNQAGQDARSGAVTLCERGRFVVEEDRRSCLWDVAARRLVRAISKEDYEHGDCIFGTDELIAVSDSVDDDDANEMDGSPAETHPCTTRGPRPTLDYDDGHRVVCPTSGAIVRLESSEGFDGVELSPDARFASGVSADGQRRIWDTATGRVRWRTPVGPEEADVAFDDPSGDVLVYGASLRKVALGTGRIAIVPANEACAVGHGSRSDLAARIACRLEYMHSDSTPEAGLYGIAGSSIAYYDPRDPLIRVLPDSDRAREWTISRSGSLTSNSTTFSDRSYDVAVSEDGAYVAVRDLWAGIELRDRHGRRWSVSPNDIPSASYQHLGLEIRNGSGPARLVATELGGWLKIWDAAGKELASQFDARDVAIDRDGRRLAMWSDGELSITDLATRAVTTIARPPIGSDVRSIAWSRDGQQLIAVVIGGAAIWDLAAGGPPTMLYSNGDGAIAVGQDVLQALGDVTKARELVACRVGARLYPYPMCQSRFEVGW